MPTKLFLRNTLNNAISAAGVIYYDMVSAAGAASDTGVVDTLASGTEIQWTKDAAGDIEIQWVSGRAPAGGFTLTSTDISIWAQESNMNANCGGRYRVFKRTAAGVETEIGGGPFNDGVEFGTAAAEMLWAGNVTDTAFAENDRILLKTYITNVGTMGGGFTCTLTFNGANGATGDSFFNLAETVTFKLEDVTGTVAATTAAATGSASGTVTVSGSVAASAADATSSASGTVTVSGTVAATAADATSSASGTVSAGGITGSVAATGADATASASGTVTTSGTVAVTAAAATGSASGTVTVSGSVAASAADATSSASGTVSGGEQPPAYDDGAWTLLTGEYPKPRRRRKPDPLPHSRPIPPTPQPAPAVVRVAEVRAAPEPELEIREGLAGELVALHASRGTTPAKDVALAIALLLAA